MYSNLYVMLGVSLEIKTVFWKIYSILYLLLGVPACLSAVVAPFLHSAGWLLDLALSIAACVILLKFAYGKPAHNLVLWRLIGISFIVFDLYHNLVGDMSNENLAMVLVSLPAYIGVMLYAMGKTAKVKAKLPKLSKPVTIDFDAEDDALWAAIEKTHLESIAATAAADALKNKTSAPAQPAKPAETEPAIVISTRKQCEELEYISGS